MRLHPSSLQAVGLASHTVWWVSFLLRVRSRTAVCVRMLCLAIVNHPIVVQTSWHHTRPSAGQAAAKRSMLWIELPFHKEPVQNSGVEQTASHPDFLEGVTVCFCYLCLVADVNSQRFPPLYSCFCIPRGKNSPAIH